MCSCLWKQGRGWVPDQSCSLLLLFLSLKAGPQTVLGICLFAPTSSLHAALHTAFPRFHCQLAPGLLQPVEGSGTTTFFPPISRKTLLPDPRPHSCPQAVFPLPHLPTWRSISHRTTRFLGLVTPPLPFICLALIVVVASFCVSSLDGLLVTCLPCQLFQHL